MNTAPRKLVVISLMVLQFAFLIGVAFAFGLEDNLTFHEITHSSASAQVMGVSDSIGSEELPNQKDLESVLQPTDSASPINNESEIMVEP